MSVENKTEGINIKDIARYLGGNLRFRLNCCARGGERKNLITGYN